METKITGIETTGELIIKDDGAHCKDCDTNYWINPNGRVQCNGYLIELCPECRIDSKPWTNGRGS